MPSRTRDTPGRILPSVLWYKLAKRNRVSDLNCSPRKGLRGSPNPAPQLGEGGFWRRGGQETARAALGRQPRFRGACGTRAHGHGSARRHGQKGPECRSDPGSGGGGGQVGTRTRRHSTAVALEPRSGNCRACSPQDLPPGGEHPTTRGLRIVRGPRERKGGGHPTGRLPLPPGSTSPGS